MAPRLSPAVARTQWPPVVEPLAEEGAPAPDSKPWRAWSRDADEGWIQAVGAAPGGLVGSDSSAWSTSAGARQVCRLRGRSFISVATWWRSPGRRVPIAEAFLAPRMRVAFPWKKQSTDSHSPS